MIYKALICVLSFAALAAAFAFFAKQLNDSLSLRYFRPCQLKGIICQFSGNAFFP